MEKIKLNSWDHITIDLDNHSVLYEYVSGKFPDYKNILEHHELYTKIEDVPKVGYVLCDMRIYESDDIKLNLIKYKEKNKWEIKHLFYLD